MTKSHYLARRQARLSLDELKRDIVFGLVVSGMLSAVGLWKYFFLIGASDRLWLLVAALGGIGLLLSLVFPSAWHLPQSALGAVIRTVGGALFAVLLGLVYILLMTPLGWLVRVIKGNAPIYQWAERPPPAMEGWYPKEVLFETNQGHGGSQGPARRFLNVMAFFASRGHYVFLPTLVILVALGLVLFFVKTSALAPLIYTLF
ncbi:DUF5989 family protein [uncultured Thiodictyon sp.]|uniref:DUF5989 family protein n=1 Tax=uncultured Thiodictyon sp. TaxID=1846217 RepID=UPI00260147CC|nr:DUF5989 family protein [uncultured Thiodictyon sp.]